MRTFHVTVYCDLDGGHRAVLADNWADIYRTKRMASLSNCKATMRCWVAENLGDYRLHWHLIESHAPPPK